MVEIRINPVEVCSVLAETRMKDEMTHRIKERLGVKFLSVKDINVYIYIKNGEEEVFTDEAQDLYNSFYDMYFEVLTNSQITEE